MILLQPGITITSLQLGYGRFGSLFYRYFQHAFGLKVYDPFAEIPRDILKAEPDTAAVAQYIFFAVPISLLEQTALAIKPFIQSSSVLVDLCSVKEYPVQLLKNLFPENEIVGTHPLFGPDSAADSLAGRQIVLCRTGNDTLAYRYLETSFRAEGLSAVSMSPEEHDQQMAWTLCLTQFIGRGLAELPLPQNGIGTKGYFDLLDIITRANRDTTQLFVDMNLFNRFADDMRAQAIQGFTGVQSFLNSQRDNPQ